MKSFEKETIQAQLKDEDKCLKDLEKAYKQAKKDCQQKLRNLNSRKDMHNLQSIIHQKKYQEALLKQIDGVLNDLQTHTYKTANDFFQGSYQNGYIGSMYELQKQGIPMTIPVSTKKMVTAIQTKSKLSQSYYEKQGLTIQNIRTLKKQIALEATRGIASGKSWMTVADSLTIQRYFDISQSDAMRIVRTEGNRINQQARLDAGDEAVQNGCDLLKQWDATLDSVTRPAHREADGQIVEWGEKFTVMGEKLDAPSIGGSASNVINCRCQLLKRPRWSLDEEELEVLKQRASYYGLDKTKSFEDYKEKFLKIPDNEEEQLQKLKDSWRKTNGEINSKNEELRELQEIKKAREEDYYSKYDGMTKQDLIDRQNKLQKELDSLDDELDRWDSEHKRPSLDDYDDTDEGWEAYSKAKKEFREERKKFREYIASKRVDMDMEFFELEGTINSWDKVELYRKAKRFTNEELTKKIDDLYDEIRRLENNNKDVNSKILDLQNIIREKEEAKKLAEAVAKGGVTTLDGVDVKVYKRKTNLGDGTSTGVKKIVDANVYITPEGVEFEFPVKLDRNKQKLTPEQLMKAWEKVPKGIRDKAPKRIQVLDYYNPQDTYWKKVYKKFTHSYATGGVNGVTFYRYDYEHDDDYLVRTLCHELGHVADQKIETPTKIRFCDSTDWTEAMSKDLVHCGMKSPTRYGENANAEDLAESVAEYTMNHEWFIKNFPNRTKIIESIVLKD